MAQEKRFEEQIKAWLESQGIYPLGTAKQDITVEPCGYWEKRWGGGKYVKAGLPDLHIVINGISVEVELKAKGGRVSPLQVHNLNQIDDAGCYAMVLYPDDFDKFKRLIMFIKHNQSVDVDLITLCGLQRGCRK